MKPFNRIIYVLFLSLLSYFEAAAQSYTFHHLRTNDGLSNSTIKSILKDSYGFLWIGTESGLNRYDGYGFKVYATKSDKPSSIINDDIRGLQEDGLGNIWISTESNYIVYQRNKDNFRSDIPNLLKELGIKADQNYKVYVDKNKDLWVLHGNTVFAYDTHKKRLKTFTTKEKITEASNVFLADDGNTLFRILQSGNILAINKKDGKETISKLPEFITQNIKNQKNKIFIDAQKGLWIYAKTASVFYQKNSNTAWQKIILNSSVNSQNDVIFDIKDGENGKVWIGTDHQGIFIYNTANNNSSNIVYNPDSNSSIASNNIGCLYKDDTGTMWAGHNKKGISYYNSSFGNLVNIELQDCKDVSNFLEDKKGNIWLGTDGNGLYLKEKSSGNKIRKMPISSNVIVTLLEDKKGRIWIGTYLNGLFCYENGSFKHYTTENSTLNSNDIWNLKEDRYGNLWIGTLGHGIQCLRNDTTQFETIAKTIKGLEFTLDMFYDNGDILYVGTDNGLFTIDIVTGKQEKLSGNNSKTQKFRQQFTSSVFRDSRENVWLGHSKGLSVWDTKKDTVYYFDKTNGLCDNIIKGIIEDNHQHIWITTSNGLSVLSVEPNAKGVLKISSRNFSAKDGLQDNYFNTHGIYKLQNGDILLGGTEGYIAVNPNKMAEKSKPLAKVIFTGLSLGNTTVQVDSVYNGRRLLKRSMEQTPEITFSHDDKLIAIQFTTADLINADKVRYLYKLEGFNNQWIQTEKNKIEFSSLAPGSYRFLIKAANSDGILNEKATVLDITVTPPFYLSGWAILFYIAAIAGITVYFIKQTKKKHQKELEQQRINLEHLQQINLNEMKLRFFTNISHDLRTPLTLITIPLQTILNKDLEEGLKAKLGIVYKNVEQLMTLINSLLDFRKLDVGTEQLNLKAGDFVYYIEERCTLFQSYATDRNIKFSYTSEMESLLMKFDSVKVQKILFNLLSNAFKYTPDGGSINLHIYKENKNICVTISDTGQGIPDYEKKNIFERFYQAEQNKENTGSGIGLHIVREYIAMHGGSISVKNNVPKGSIFTFSLPIQKVKDQEQIQSLEIIPEKKTDEKPILLFVDDNKDFCDFMSESLSEFYTVLIAYNGLEAIEKLQENNVNIVVSDVMMPKMSGTELCAQIKTTIEWSHIPVILLTARTAEEYKIEGLMLGADDYITKPFNFNLLKLRVDKFLDWTKKSHQAFSQKIDVVPSEITITSLDEQLIEKAIKTVEENISNPDFTVEELSAIVGLSRTHLYKKLMHITGKGPAEFIRTVRLKRARQLLEKSQLQIAEIAYAVGFNSPKRFTVNFKNEFGISPSEYLRNLK
ncbi:hybrid sensor histidine kinase/response regulator transcription factor [Flavobacterium sp. 1355]|uniref:hybrid sensor histidine kinase/response regulator transcription factor n=1 Tax=Flavobacterium sp. 1355 TaxID=2806571 RepID=UPI001AEB7E76|nr:hybrid sensor histidine kinase/response regulator transcription factor [Flavobacterium sp. 1355]MBP1221697.1 signal transduction histidine kinase/ligand-binding sensor domain-containing protein/DNA-binding response OmpR family regulator [Flavobacterium sp. 1355]